MATTVTIHIDMRERDLIPLFGPGEATVENLELGDVQIRYGPTIFVFERKTAADLAASIKDGRWREQKTRVLAHTPAHRVAYLIEGYKHLATPQFGLQQSVFMGAFLSAMFRDGTHPIFTSGPGDSVRWIKELAVRLNKDPSKFCPAFQDTSISGGQEEEPTPAPAPYIDSVKVKKRKCENIDPATCYQLQLCQIPGLSIVIAKAIAAVYPGMRELLEALTAASSPIAQVELLSQIPLIGRKKATQIIQFMGFAS